MMPYHAKSHMQNRKKVCIICMRKAKCTISELVAQQLRLHIVDLENYDCEDPQLPQGICGTCRVTLGKITTGTKDTTHLPDIFNYKAFIVSFTKDYKMYVPNMPDSKEKIFLSKINTGTSFN